MKEITPLISIVIACYNDILYVEQAINSAINQSYSNKEIIVVDDGSDEETKQLLRNIESNISKLIFQDNLGQSSARNTGIKACQGEFVLVLDSDDFFEPTFCKKAIKYFIDNKNVKIVTCFAKLLYDDGSIKYHSPNGGTISNFKFSNEALGTSLFRKLDWSNCSGYDETMRNGYEDWEFFIRILKNGGTVEVIQEPLYNYRKRNNTTTAKANINKYRLLEYIYIKHKDLYINDFDNFVKKILEQSIVLEQQKQLQLKKIDYRLGNLILRPIRFLKRNFK